MTEADMRQIRSLEEIIRKNSEAYYSGNGPHIDDNAFDLLVEQLKAIYPESEVLKSTGWGIKMESSKKIPHKYGKVIGIPDKIRPYEISKKFKKFNSFDICVITPKLDGCSVLLYYVNGQLEQALTRGDGEFGQNILSKVKSLVPNSIDNFTGVIRGEFIIPINAWNSKYKNEKSARNYAAGYLSRLEVDADEINNFRVVAYYAKPENGAWDKETQLRFLQDNSFDSVIYRIDTIHNLDGTVYTAESCQQLLNDISLGEFECDGLVFDCANAQFAVKWNTDGVETEVVDIIWQASRLGKFTPVVCINPVDISGATISRVTGNNYKYIIDNHIGIGSAIKIVRSGDVIPMITGVLTNSDKTNAPEICPHCGKPIVQDGVNIVCKNNKCPSRGNTTLMYFINNVTPIDGLGEQMLGKIINHFNVSNIPEFIQFANTYNTFDLLRFCNMTNGLGKVAFNKFSNLLNKYRDESLDLEKLFVGFGLPSLSTKSVAKIFELFGYKTLMEKLSSHSLQTIPGVNYIAIESLYENQDYIAEVIGLLNKEPHLTKNTKENNINYNLKVCITGALSVSRKAFLDICESYGIHEASIAKADILVTNDIESGSTKNKEAQKRGTKIMNEADFRKAYFI